MAYDIPWLYDTPTPDQYLRWDLERQGVLGGGNTAPAAPTPQPSRATSYPAFQMPAHLQGRLPGMQGYQPNQPLGFGMPLGIPSGMGSGMPQMMQQRNMLQNRDRMGALGAPMQNVIGNMLSPQRNQFQNQFNNMISAMRGRG